MQLMEVLTFEANPPQGDLGRSSTSLRTGDGGIKSLTKNSDLTIDVEGTHVSYILWPANVVRARRLPLLTAPSSLEEGASPPTQDPTDSEVAQSVEHVAVNDGDVSSSLTLGAESEEPKNSGADEASQDSVAAPTAEQYRATTSLAEIEKSARKRRSNRK